MEPRVALNSPALVPDWLTPLRALRAVLILKITEKGSDPGILSQDTIWSLAARRPVGSSRTDLETASVLDAGIQKRDAAAVSQR